MSAGSLAHDRWLAAVPVRRSRRAFDGTRPSAEALRVLGAVCGSFRPWPDARCVLLGDAPDALFRGVVGAYGRVTGAASALVMLGETASPTVAEHVGYTGEAAVLEVTALGLGTCWVGGFFDRKLASSLVPHSASERVFAVSPVGAALADAPFAERLVYHPGRPKRRRPLEEIAPGVGSWPEWVRAGVRAAQAAPSAVNREPWRFAMAADGAVELSFAGAEHDYGISKRLDCGIAMLHFELGARGAGRAGSWRPLAGRGVARWEPARAG